MGRLKSGETVTLPDGRVVRPEDVCTPVPASRPLIILECPTRHHLAHLVGSVRSSPLAIYFASTPHATTTSDAQTQSTLSTQSAQNSKVAQLMPELVVHMTGFPVSECDQYRAFIDLFPADTKHLILDGTRTLAHNFSIHFFHSSEASRGLGY